MKLLIIEDEPALRKGMADYLSSQQYLCEVAGDYDTALEKIDLYSYDCIVLDLMLPGGNGLDLLKTLKRANKLDGVIIISARNELEDKIAGLQLGADDYLTKPFHLSELSVRISAIIRRRSLQGSNTLVFEELTLDTIAKTVSVHDAPVLLTRKEYELLMYFIVNKNRVVSKNAIAGHLWGDDMDVADNYDFIYAHIKNLRKKLVQAGAGDYLQSIYGMGYKLTAK
jgi:DNA-binding response OmpR family regulator